ncbi:unnamed protein product, partial [Rotaria magnacalcarata]
KTLKILNSIERVSPLIPKFKQQLIFLEEYQKLFKKTDDRSARYDDSLSSVTANCEIPSDVLQNSQESSMVSMNSSASSIVLVSTNDREPNEFMHSSRFNQSNVGVAISKPFQDDYKIPSLPNAVIKDIEQGKLEKFGPHCANIPCKTETHAKRVLRRFKRAYTRLCYKIGENSVQTRF